MQPQENCNADVLIGKFLSEMDAETNEPEEEEEEGEEMAEAEADVDEEMEELADAGIAPRKPLSVPTFAVSCLAAGASVAWRL